MLWNGDRCYIGQNPDYNNLYYLSVPIQWTGYSVKTHQKMVVETYFCTVVYRDANAHYWIVGAWNDKNPQYHS